MEPRLHVLWCRSAVGKERLRYNPFDEAQVTLQVVLECVHLSEKTKSHLRFHSRGDLLLNSGSFGQSEHFCCCGFVSLLWLQHIMQHRSRSQCESAFFASACVQEMEPLPCFWETVWSGAMLILKESHIALLRWLLACTHFLLSPWLVLELDVDCCWFITTFSQARNSWLSPSLLSLLCNLFWSELSQLHTCCKTSLSNLWRTSCW